MVTVMREPRKTDREYQLCLCWYAKHFSEPFKDSNGYGESIARLSNMLGGGVIVQRFGDLVRGRRTNARRLEESPGDTNIGSYTW